MRSMLPVGLIALVALVALAGQASAQLTPDWDARHKGVDGFFFGFNVPVHMVTDSAGAVYVSSTVGPGLHTRDILTVKYAPDGTELWSVAYDGPSQDMDTGVDIAIDTAGDILVLGRSECGFLVIKYAAVDGSVIWTSQHDGGNCPELGNALTTDDAGNIYVTGTTRPPGGDHQWDFYTYKMDSAGNVLWTATYDGPGYFLFGDDIAVDVAVDSNGDVLVTGPSNDPNSQSNFVTIKYRGTDGAQLWLARLDIPGLESVALLISPQDDVYVTGAAVYGRTPFVTAKFDGTNGSEMWRSVNYMGSFGRAFGMAFDSVGDVYVTGRLDPDSDKSTWNENVVTMRLRASDGTRRWLAIYGDSTKGKYDEGLAIAIDAQDNVLVTGSTTSFGEFGLLLLKYDAANGKLVDHGAFPVPNEGARGQFIGLDSAQNIIVVGTTRDAGGLMDILTLKYPSQVVIGTNYCGPATLNSSGQPAVISATGSAVAAQNQLTLTASLLPTDKFGYFLNSDVQGFTPLPPGSQGNLCLAGGIGRHAKQMGNSGSAGEIALQVDLTALPRPGGSHAVVAGETWNFQCWFRDNVGGPTSNFTDGISIVFQ